ncbi:hypothetical protein LAZ67_10000875 [Cordylochernes scorpioides]|uniref:Uncharacterized protein n=1 Tax=Cordylochernes scorpioides TaxID=51811 RepID=A0ABY6KVC5_9ARAC|nr:hypothetical protein LAZ67_10000875 [Cordylochernes scorpioides]
MFSEGREDVNDEERAGRPSTSTTDEKINEVEKMILANRRITVREVAEDLNISIGSCHSIFINDLCMRRVAAKFAPKLLNCDQKQHRMNIANEMLDSVRDDPNLLQRVITGDLAWVYGYDVETKAQSSQWKLPHEPRPKKARQVRSNVKVLLTVFFDCRGVVHHEFLPQGRTVNKEYYLEAEVVIEESLSLMIKTSEKYFGSHTYHLSKASLSYGNTLGYKHKIKAGRISIEDDPRQGRPEFQRTDENVQKITDLIKENPRTTLLELEQDTGISKTTIGRIVTEDLKLKKTPAKFIPRFLTNEQKLCRLATCDDIMEMTERIQNGKTR